MADLPLIKAAKLWAKVSARTGATYLTGRWGGCRVLVFENLERDVGGGAEPLPVPGRGRRVAASPTRRSRRRRSRSRRRQVPELQAVPAAPVEDGAGEKPARRRRKARGKGRPSREGAEGPEAARGLERLGVPAPLEGGCRTGRSRGRAVHRGPARRHRAAVGARRNSRAAGVGAHPCHKRPTAYPVGSAGSRCCVGTLWRSRRGSIRLPARWAGCRTASRPRRAAAVASWRAGCRLGPPRPPAGTGGGAVSARPDRATPTTHPQDVVRG